MKSVNESFEAAIKLLKDCKGALVGRVEEFRKLGAKVSKQFPEQILEKRLLKP